MLWHVREAKPTAPAPLCKHMSQRNTGEGISKKQLLKIRQGDKSHLFSFLMSTIAAPVWQCFHLFWNVSICWLWMCKGMISRHIFSAVMKDQGCCRVTSETARSIPSFIPMHASTSNRFLQHAHAHATRPEIPPLAGQWYQLTALTCSVNKSLLSFCGMTRCKLQQKLRAEHRRGSSRGFLTQTPAL